MAHGPSVAELHGETGRRNNELPTVVVSDSLTPADAEAVDRYDRHRPAGRRARGASWSVPPGSVVDAGLRRPVPRLRLLGSRRRDGSDNVLLRYAVGNVTI